MSAPCYNRYQMNAQRIKTIRKLCNMSQEAFAHMIGVTFSTVNRWEMGKATPSTISARLLIALEKKLHHHEKVTAA